MGAIAKLLLTLLLAFLIYYCIHYFGEKRSRKERNRILNEFEARQNAERAVRTQKYTDTVERHLNSFYSEISVVWNKPSNPLTVEVLRFKSEKEILDAQATLPDEWFRWADVCDCWISDGVLYIFEQNDSASGKAKNYPEQYDSEEKIRERVVRHAIPLTNIHYFKANGTLVRSLRTVLPGSVSYTGVLILKTAAMLRSITAKKAWPHYRRYTLVMTLLILSFVYCHNLRNHERVYIFWT